MRIAMVIPRYFPMIGGAETQCRLLIRHLLDGGQVTVPFVVTRRLDNTESRLQAVDGISVCRLGAPGTTRWQEYSFYLLAAYFLLRHSAEFDVIHCHATSVVGFVMTLTGRLIRRPVILKLSSNGELAGKIAENPLLTPAVCRWRSPLRRRMAAYVGRTATIVALNEEGLSELRALRANWPLLIPNGVDTNAFFRPSHAARSAVRKELGVRCDTFLLLYVGRFVRSKGLDILLRSLAVLQERSPNSDLLLLLVGSADLQPDAIDGLLLEQARGRHDLIRVVGPTSNPQRYYHASDALAFPSRREGLPNVVLEALATGLPCILSDIAPHREIKADHPKAPIRLFTKDSASALTEAIMATMRNMSTSKTPGTADQMTWGLSERYQIGTVASQYITEYELLLKAHA
jgi:glycosyltransferase involved in cell wall biosynthesis